jgi:hypothetical protein
MLHEAKQSLCIVEIYVIREIIFNQRRRYYTMIKGRRNPEYYVTLEIKPTFRSLEKGFLDMNTCCFCLFYKMVILAKKRQGRRNGMKNRRCFKGKPPTREKHRSQCGVDGGKGFNARQSCYSKKRECGS